MKSYLLLLCLIFSIQVKCEFNLIDFSDDHKMVVFCHASDTVIHYYNRDHNVTREISPGIGIISKISVTAAKLFIAKGSYGKLFIFDAVREKTIGFISGVNDFIVSDDRLIYGTRNGEVVFLHLKSFETKRFTTHYGPVAALALKNDNSALAIAGDDGSIKLLDMKKYVINAENVLETGNIQGIAFNESGNRLFISVPNVLYEWNSHLRFSAVYDCSETGKLSNFEKEIFIVDAIYSYGMEKNIIRLDKKYIINVSNEPFAQRKGEILFISHYGDDFITVCIYDRTKEPRLGVYDMVTVSKIKGKIDSFRIQNDSRQTAPLIIEKMPITLTDQVIDLKSAEGALITEKVKKVKGNNVIELINQVGYAGPLHYLGLSADGKYIVTTAESPVVKIWDKESNILVKEINIGKFNVLKSAVHPRLPLLAVLDQNRVLHVYDLISFSEISTIQYSNRGYFEIYDTEHESSSMFNLFFNKSGCTLNFLSSENSFDDNDQSFRMPLTALLEGKWKPVSDKMHKAYLSAATESAYPLLYARKDSVESIVQTKRYRLDSVSSDSTRLTFNNYGRRDIIGVKDLYLDDRLDKPADFFNDTAEIVFFYKRKYEQVTFGYLIAQSADEKYQIIKNNNGTHLLSTLENKVIRANISDNFFFTPDSKFFVDDSVLIELKTGEKINFLSRIDEKKEEYSYYYTIPKSVFFYDKENQIIVIWRKTFDHQYISFDTKRKQLSIVKFKRPLIGRVVQSVNTPLAYIAYHNYFTQVNFLSLSSNDYLINSRSELTRRNPSGQTQSNFIYNFDDDNQQAGFSWVNVYLQSPDGKKIASHWVDLSNSTIKNDEFYLYDTLQKHNFYRPRLSPAQRLQWELQNKKFEQFLNNKTFIRADTRTPIEYRYLNEVGISTNSIRYSEEDFDTLYHAFTNEYFGILLSSAITGKTIKNFNPPPVGHYLLRFLYEQDKFVTYGFDGMSRVWDCKGQVKDPIVTYLRDSINHMFITHDNYYKTTSRAFNMIKFRHNNKVYGIEQFDIKYNRPDIVLQRIGSKDTLMIRAYHKAYLKRLKKLGYTEDMLKEDADLPEIKIKNYESLPDYSDSSFISLDLELNDKNSKLDRINVWINDVPVYGTSGINLRTLNVQSLSKTINIELAEGKNKIQVSVLNQAGVESYREEVYVTRQSGSSPPNLYLISIGDNKYKDSRFDLTYASKDAQDIQNAFSDNEVFGNIYRFILTNEQVTVENVRKIKTELHKAGRNDVVILFVAGHGVLDSDFNYYLATYDMDFINPAGKGLAYEELESLLDGIQPLKKLILMDACHSGEIDKDEVQLLATSVSAEGEIKFRNAGAGISKKNLGLKSASGLMQELFGDFRRGTGATVISSAGGAEFAIESDQWKNGLFTYCLLRGLSDMSADIDKDGKVMLSELQQYLRIEVTKLSNGAQQPTSRIENLSTDFQIK